MQENELITIEEVEEQETPKRELSLIEPRYEQKGLNMWNDVKTFEATQRMARLLAESNIVPQAYKGKLADCVIAIDIANRIGVSPIVVMQNSQVVNNNFSWKGTACKAMIDGYQKYAKTRYVEVGEEGKDSFGVYLEAITKDGEVIKGVTVTVAMAKAEGWWQRNPKWANLTSLMLRYRASAFFMRTECAGLAMGFLTAEENEDIANLKNNKSNITNILDEEMKGE